MERTEWPSETRLVELRKLGQVPLSNMLLRCVFIVSFLGAVFYQRDLYRELTSYYWGSHVESAARANSGLAGSSHSVVSPSALSQAKGQAGKVQASSLIGKVDVLSPKLESVVRLLLLPIVVALSLTLIVGLLQTRFLFQLGLIGPDFGRLGWSLSISRGAGVFCAAVIGALVGLFSLFCMARLLVPRFLALLKADSVTMGVLALDLLVRVFAGAMLVLMILACFDMLLQRRLFMLRHRMSREELANEQDELRVR